MTQSFDMNICTLKCQINEEGGFKKTSGWKNQEICQYGQNE